MRIFSYIYEKLKKEHVTLFISQDSYKNENAEKTMIELNIPFKKIEKYDRKHPKSILQNENIGVIIVGNDTDVIPQWFINWGNKLGIPSVLIQDGLFFDMKTIKQNRISKLVGLLTTSKLKLLFLAASLLLTHQYKRVRDGLGGCTQIQVWGTKSQEYFIKNGVDEQKIVITGSIKADNIVQHKEGDKQQKFILYAPTNMVKTNLVTNDFMKEMTMSVCTTVGYFNDLTLIIKPHGAENISSYKNLVKKFGDKVQVIDTEIIKSLEKADLLITNLSTTVIDALCMRKPVIIYLPNVGNYVDENSFPRDLIANNTILYANDVSSLIKNINLVTSDSYEQQSDIKDKILSEYVGPRDGNSVYRSCLNIINLIK